MLCFATRDQYHHENGTNGKTIMARLKTEVGCLTPPQHGLFGGFITSRSLSEGRFHGNFVRVPLSSSPVPLGATPAAVWSSEGLGWDGGQEEDEPCWESSSTTVLEGRGSAGVMMMNFMCVLLDVAPGNTVLPCVAAARSRFPAMLVVPKYPATETGRT